MQQPASPHARAVWTLTDGHAGNVRQASALARALGFDPIAFDLRARAPWRWWSPRRAPFDMHAFGDAFRDALRAPPALAIGCGRQGALATRLLRGRSRRDATTRAVQILDPRIDPAHWDVLVAPDHDALRGSNVITLLGSLHPVDDAWLAAGRVAFPTLASLPSPRTTLLIGGPSAHWPVDASRMSDWIEHAIGEIRARGGSVLATTSRRTPSDVRAQVRALLRDVPHVLWTGDADGPNPYASVLAHAQRIVCTADSVNMLSEACATYVPVEVLGLEALRGRPLRFVDALRDRGRVGDGSERADIEPLRETARVAAAIRARLDL